MVSAVFVEKVVYLKKTLKWLGVTDQICEVRLELLFGIHFDEKLTNISENHEVFYRKHSNRNTVRKYWSISRWEAIVEYLSSIHSSFIASFAHTFQLPVF